MQVTINDKRLTAMLQTLSPKINTKTRASMHATLLRPRAWRTRPASMRTRRNIERTVCTVELDLARPIFNSNQTRSGKDEKKRAVSRGRYTHPCGEAVDEHGNPELGSLSWRQQRKGRLHLQPAAEGSQLVQLRGEPKVCQPLTGDNRHESSNSHARINVRDEIKTHKTDTTGATKHTEQRLS